MVLQQHARAVCAGDGAGWDMHTEGLPKSCCERAGVGAECCHVEYEYFGEWIGDDIGDPYTVADRVGGFVGWWGSWGWCWWGAGVGLNRGWVVLPLETEGSEEAWESGASGGDGDGVPAAGDAGVSFT